MGIMDNVLKGTTIGDAAESIGMPSAPITQAGVAATGASNPDSIKMAGTPNQKMATLQQAVKRSTDVESSVFGTEIRQKRLTAGQAEKERQAQAERLRKVGDVDERLAAKVKQNTEAKQQTKVSEAIASNSVVNTTAIAGLGLDVAKTIELTTALNTLLKRPEDVAALAKVQELTRLTGVAQIQGKLITQDPSKAAAIFAQEIPQSAALGMLDDSDWEAIGLTNADQAAQTLGITKDQLVGMTFKQFQETVGELRRQGFSTTKDLQAKMNDPTVGPATRAELLRELRQRGEIGADSADALVGDLEAQMTNGVETSINGIPVSISDLLTTDETKGAILDLLESPDRLEALPDTDPFKQWFKGNQAALNTWAATLDKTFQTTKVNKDSYEAARALPGSDVIITDDSVMKTLIPGWSPNSTSALNTTNATSTWRLLQDPSLPAQDRAQIVNALTSAVTARHTGLAQELANIQGMGALRFIAQNPGALQQLKETRDQFTYASEALTRGEAGKQEVYGMIYGDPKVIEKANAAKVDPSTIAPGFNTLPKTVQNKIKQELAGLQVTDGIGEFLKNPTTIAELLAGKTTQTPANPLDAVNAAVQQKVQAAEQTKARIVGQLPALSRTTDKSAFDAGLRSLITGEGKDYATPEMLQPFMNSPIIKNAFSSVEKLKAVDTLNTADVLFSLAKATGTKAHLLQKIPGINEWAQQMVSTSEREIREEKAAAEKAAEAERKRQQALETRAQRSDRPGRR